MSNSSLAVEIKGLSIQYPSAKKKALDNLDFQVPAGAFFGLLGPNGAGKTTLISFLCGQVNGQYSTAKILDVDRQSIYLYKKKLGYAPQEVALYPTLTAHENLMFFARLLEVPKTEVIRVLEWVGLSDSANKKVNEFSGGMKRRLNLGVALLNNPKLLILDEPTVGIDPQSRNFIFEKILELKKQGVTLIYSTHYLEEVKKLCDEVGVLQEGRMVACGKIGDVFKNSDFEKRYLELTGREM